MFRESLFIKQGDLPIFARNSKMTKILFCILSVVFVLQTTSASNFFSNNLVKTEQYADENQENSGKSTEENKSEKEQIFLHNVFVLNRNAADFFTPCIEHNYTSGFLNDPFQPPRTH